MFDAHRRRLIFFAVVVFIVFLPVRIRIRIRIVSHIYLRRNSRMGIFQFIRCRWWRWRWRSWWQWRWFNSSLSPPRSRHLYRRNGRNRGYRADGNNRPVEGRTSCTSTALGLALTLMWTTSTARRHFVVRMQCNANKQTNKQSRRKKEMNPVWMDSLVAVAVAVAIVGTLEALA